MVNNPAEVRNNPEKLLPLQFPEFIPPTLISANAADIRAFHREQKEIVLKPMYGFGGSGIFYIDREGHNLNALLELMLAQSKEPLVAQKFLPEGADEERRVVMLDGKPRGIISRTPARGEIRSNLYAGGKLGKATITKTQAARSEIISAELDKRGILFAGLDFIGDWLIEINITSPGGIREFREMEGVDLSPVFWDAVERRL